MSIEGGCYCGAVRYAAEGDAAMKAQCFCRECQYISGGSQNVIMAMPEAGFSWTKGAAKEFRRADVETPVTRAFCAECGTHIISIAPSLGGMVMVKVGTLDDPAVFGGPQMSIFTVDQQPFHHVTENVPSFDRIPG